LSSSEIILLMGILLHRVANSENQNKNIALGPQSVNRRLVPPAVLAERHLCNMGANAAIRLYCGTCRVTSGSYSGATSKQQGTSVCRDDAVEYKDIKG
jgi:hypothetical protein